MPFELILYVAEARHEALLARAGCAVQVMLDKRRDPFAAVTCSKYAVLTVALCQFLQKLIL